MAAEKALTGEVLTGPPVKIPAEVMKMSVSMSEKTDPEMAQQYVGMVCAAYSKRDDDLSKLRYLLGRMVLAIREHKLYQPNYRLFGDYIAYLETEHRVKGTTIYNAVNFVELLPEVSLELAGGISIRNQNIAAKAARKATPAQLKEIVRHAELPESEYREALAEKGIGVKQGRPKGGRRNTGTVTLSILEVAARTAQRFRTNAKEYDSQAKYLNHLMSLDKSTTA